MLIVKNFAADDYTRSKFLFYGGPDCLHMKDGLEVYIDSEAIPDFLGGPCEVSTQEWFGLKRNVLENSLVANIKLDFQLHWNVTAGIS